jgi:hypothetical protein
MTTMATEEEPNNTLNANDIHAQGDVVVGQKIVINHNTGVPPAAPASPTNTPAALPQRLYALLSAHWFDQNDLQDLAFKLGIDWDNLSGDAKSGKARALVRHCEMHDQLPQLQQAMRLARPNLQHVI